MTLYIVDECLYNAVIKGYKYKLERMKATNGKSDKNPYCIACNKANH